METYNFSSQSVQFLLQVVNCRWGRCLLVMTIMVPIMVTMKRTMKRTMMTMMILMMAMKRRLMMMMSLILSIGLESFTPSLISFADWRHQLLRGRLSIGKDGGLVMVLVKVMVRVMVRVVVRVTMMVEMEMVRMVVIGEMEIKFGWRGHF